MFLSHCLVACQVNKAEEVTERSQWQEEAEKKMAELERKNRVC